MALKSTLLILFCYSGVRYANPHCSAIKLFIQTQPQSQPQTQPCVQEREHAQAIIQVEISAPGAVAMMLIWLKCYDNKMARSPFSLIILPLIRPQVANQQQQKK